MEVNNQKTYTFYVSGMHCKSCVFLTEGEINKSPEVSRATSSLKNRTVDVTGDFGIKNSEEIARDLSALLVDHGYSLSTTRQKNSPQWTELIRALPIVLGITVLYIFLQKIGLVNYIQGDTVSYGTAFMIGVIASVSTCLAVVGGLVLSMAATSAKRGNAIRPQILFHLGRIVAFFFLGGVIGAIGSAFTLNALATFVLGVLIAAVMFVMGLNLLDIFEWPRRIQPTMPKFITRRVLSDSSLTHSLTPALIGISTFFLPCGFTQSMQLYTLSTGSFVTGGLTMLSFALGTLPVLGAISVGSHRIQTSAHAGLFFKVAGLLVILFALFNLINSFVAMGFLPPLFIL